MQSSSAFCISPKLRQGITLDYKMLQHVDHRHYECKESTIAPVQAEMRPISSTGYTVYLVMSESQVIGI